LIAAAELRHQIFCAGVIAQPFGGVSTEVDGRGGESELLGVAEKIPMAPGDAAAAAEIGGEGGIQADQALWALAGLERYRDAPRAVGGGAQPNAYRGKNAQPQEILGRSLNLAGAIGFATLQRQPRTYQGLMYPFQSADADVTHLNLRSSHNVKA